MEYRLKDLTAQFLSDLELRNLSRITIKNYRLWLNHFAEYLAKKHLEMGQVSREVVKDYIRAEIERGHSPNTINNHLNAIRLFFSYLITEGYWPTPNPVEEIKPLRVGKRIKPVGNPETVGKLFGAVGGTEYTRLRSQAILVLMLDGMLRLGEVLSLKKDDVNLDEGWVIVTGKGNHQRRVDSFGAKAILILQEYREKRKGRPGTAFICNEFDGRPLTSRYVQMTITRMAKRAGLKISPHDLRRAGACLRAAFGEEPIRLQKLLGHSHWQTTEKYLGGWDGRIMNGQTALSVVDTIY